MNSKSKKIRALQPATYLNICRLAAITIRLILLVAAGLSTSNAQRIQHNEDAHVRALAENTQRTRIGLRPVGKDWICFRSSHGKDEWIANEADKAAVKVVRRDARGQLLSEEDRYLSGKWATVDEAVLEEELVLTYDYASKQMEVSYIGSNPEIKRELEHAKTNQGRLDLVKRVKSQWGL
jgi:hypothetical protein